MTLRIALTVSAAALALVPAAANAATVAVTEEGTQHTLTLRPRPARPTRSRCALTAVSR